MYNTDEEYVRLYEEYGEVVIEIYPGKSWGRGYTEERRDSFLNNLGTENGLIKFDIRHFFRNLIDVDDWFRYIPSKYTYDLEARQEGTRKKMQHKRRVKHAIPSLGD
jgi:hypothetical protein